MLCYTRAAVRRFPCVARGQGDPDWQLEELTVENRQTRARIFTAAQRQTGEPDVVVPSLITRRSGCLPHIESSSASATGEPNQRLLNREDGGDDATTTHDR